MGDPAMVIAALVALPVMGLAIALVRQSVNAPRRRNWSGSPVRRPAGAPGRWGRWLPARRWTEPPLPRVSRLVLAPDDGPPPEPPLAPETVIECTKQLSLAHGRCGGHRETARLTVRGVTLRGLGHALDCAPGQDAAGIHWHEPSRALYAAVADGLGSLPRSATAAKRAVQAGMRFAARRSDRSFVDRGPELFATIAHAIAESVPPAPDTSSPTGATTLVLAEVRPATAGAVISICGVGDSEAWLLDADGWRSLHHERDEDRENATRQLPRHPFPRTYVVTASRGTVLLLATDGFAGALGTKRSTLGRTLAGLWRTVPSAVEFAAHVDFVDAYRSDDRTAVAVWIR